MAKVFCSARLIYRALEDNDRDNAFMHSLDLDSAGRANYSAKVFCPSNKLTSKGSAARFRDDSYMAAMVCLPAPLGEEQDSDTGETSSAKAIPVGVINLHRIAPGHQHHRSTNFGIQIAPEYQGMGYGSEAIRWLLQWAFKYGGLHRVGVIHYSYNPRAGRLYQRLGFVPEGIMRQCLWYNGGWHDRIVMSMLEDEWRKEIQEEEYRNKGLNGSLGDLLGVSGALSR